MRQLRKVTGKVSNCQYSYDNNYFNAIKSNSVFNRESGFDGSTRLSQTDKFACLLTNHPSPIYAPFSICGYLKGNHTPYSPSKASYCFLKLWENVHLLINSSYGKIFLLSIACALKYSVNVGLIL